MILFAILALIAIILIGFVIAIVSVTGAIGIIVFGDVIVCVVFIVLLIHHFMS